MSNYNLERLTVLVVEDSPFIQSLLINSLKILGVGNVFVKSHGGEAIDFITLVKKDPMKAGTQSIDLIMSNWEMSPVDGLMLLRWVRRHKDSPDRFVPFIMITGHSHPERVREARELGVTEFLSKPFTIKAIGERLASIIERQRQFVHTASYFGPDRRRGVDSGYAGPERRTLTDKSPGVEVILG